MRRERAFALLVGLGCVLTVVALAGVVVAAAVWTFA